MTAQVLKAKSANPDAMLIWSACRPVVILRAAQSAGFNKPIFTSYGAGTTISSRSPAARPKASTCIRCECCSRQRSRAIPRRRPSPLNNTYMATTVPRRCTRSTRTTPSSSWRDAADDQGPVTRDAIRDALSVEISGTNGISG
jgi:hypothetical protein